jgi:hypothetical protein
MGAKQGPIFRGNRLSKVSALEMTVLAYAGLGEEHALAANVGVMAMLRDVEPDHDLTEGIA